MLDDIMLLALVSHKSGQVIIYIMGVMYGALESSTVHALTEFSNTIPRGSCTTSVGLSPSSPAVLLTLTR